MPLEEQPQKSIDSINDNFELESQFILRLPSLPAASLRAAIKSGKYYFSIINESKIIVLFIFVFVK